MSLSPASPAWSAAGAVASATLMKASSSSNSAGSQISSSSAMLWRERGRLPAALAAQSALFYKWRDSLLFKVILLFHAWSPSGTLVSRIARSNRLAGVGEGGEERRRRLGGEGRGRHRRRGDGARGGALLARVHDLGRAEQLSEALLGELPGVWALVSPDIPYQTNLPLVLVVVFVLQAMKANYALNQVTLLVLLCL